MRKRPLLPGTCEWCGRPCEMEDVACSLTCEALMNRLEASQGQMVVRAMKLWRKNRGRKGTDGEGLIGDISAMVDRFMRNDRLRREEMATSRRAEAAMAQEKAARKRAPKAAPRQSAAPPEAGYDGAGDLDAGAENHTDHTHRGFTPQ